MDASKVCDVTTKSSAGIVGTQYEVRLALIYLIKALLTDYDSFQLGSNVPEIYVYKLDDVVLLYQKNGISYGFFVQAKNISRKINLDAIKSEGRHADYSLKRYYQSFQTIIQKVASLKTFRCVLLARQPIKHEDRLKDFVIDRTGEDFSLWLPGQIYQLKREEIAKEMGISEEEKPDFFSFLETFYLAVDQPDEDTLKTLILDELTKLVPFSSKVKWVFHELVEKFEDWYKEPKRKSFITKEMFQKWLSEITGQNCELINPFRNPRPDCTLKWSELKQQTQNKFQEVPVLFQGREVPLSLVATSSDLEAIDDVDESFCISKLLVQNINLRVGVEPSLVGSYTPTYYVGRTIQSVPVEDTWSSYHAHLDYVNEQADGSPFSDEPKLVSKSEKEFLSGDQRVVIISDVPGMGKSTILASFYHQLKQNHPDWWLMSIDIKNMDCDEWANLNQLDISDLAKILKLDNRFEELVFRHRMEKVGGMSFMLDGFDEVQEDRRLAIVKLIKCLLKFRVDRLFITCRTNVKKDLENELRSFSCTLRPFTEEEQISFLVSFWKSLIEKPTQDLRRVANVLIEKLRSSINAFENFVGIPLQCQMLALIFLNHRSKIVRVPESLDSAQLYRLFVEGKLKIYVDEKLDIPMKAQPLVSAILQKAIFRRLQLKALNNLFPDNPFLWMNKELDDGFPPNELLNSGLICGTNNNFIHHSLAEYFAAVSLANMFQKEENRDFVRQTVCVERRLSGVRHFMYCLLKENSADYSIFLS